MKSIGLERIGRGEPERNLMFAYLLSKWLGIFAYLTAIWIGAFSSVVIITVMMNDGMLGIDFVLNFTVTALLLFTGVVALVALMMGKIFLERVAIIPVIIGLTTVTFVYALSVIQEIVDGQEISPTSGVSGAILTGMIAYLTLRLVWISSTAKIAKKRNVENNIEAD